MWPLALQCMAGPFVWTGGNGTTGVDGPIGSQIQHVFDFAGHICGNVGREVESDAWKFYISTISEFKQIRWVQQEHELAPN